jgi:PAS domain S-box-containing protein
VFVPLRDGDRPLGMLRLGIGNHRGRPDAQDLVFLETLGERAARGLASTQLVADLRRTRRRVERILDALAEAVVVHDESGRTVWANDAAARLLGAASVEEVVSREPRDLAARFHITHEDGSPVGIDDFPGRRVVLGQDAPPMLTRSVRRDTGEERWLLTKATLLDDDGERYAVNIIEEVTEAKRAERRLRFLAHAGEVLGASLDPERTLRDVAALIVPELADWCAIDLVEDGEVSRVAIAHADPERLEFAHEIERRYPQDPKPGEGVQALLDGGPPLLIEEITVEMLEHGARDEQHLAMLREAGMRSVLLLPLRAGDDTIGVLTLITAESARAFDASDLAFHEDFAKRAATAVENARRFSRRPPA